MLLLLSAGFLAGWCSGVFADPANQWHAAIFGVIGIICSLAGAFYAAGSRRLEEMRKVKLDLTALSSLQRKLDRRSRRMLLRHVVVIIAGVIAALSAAALTKGLVVDDAAVQAVRLGYGALTVAFLSLLYFALESSYISRQVRALEQDEKERQRKLEFKRRTTSSTSA